MDLISLIIGLSFLAIFIIPFRLVRRSNRKKEQVFLQKFTSLAVEKGFNISEHDTWRLIYAIGINEEKTKLFYWHVKNEENQFYVIDLDNSCSSKVVRSNKTTEAKDEVIDRLELVITTKNSVYSLEFFNSDYVGGLSDELLLIEKWNLKVG